MHNYVLNNTSVLALSFIRVRRNIHKDHVVSPLAGPSVSQAFRIQPFARNGGRQYSYQAIP